MDDLSHCATVACAVPAATAYAYLADAAGIGEWALGCWGAQPAGEATVVGRSLFDGRQTVVRVVGHPQALAIDYHVGSGEDDLVPRIGARVVPGPVVGRGEDECFVSLLAWRSADMDDARWRRLVASHEAEVLLVRARIEVGAAASRPAMSRQEERGR